MHPFAELRGQFADAIASIGLRQSFGRFAFRFATVSYFASAIIG
jgi:hypothetical protein